MIFNRAQLKELAMKRQRLSVLLSQDEEDVEALRAFQKESYVLQGFTRHWITLIRQLEERSMSSGSSPHEGHIFIEAFVAEDARALDRLLHYIDIDLEKQWEVVGCEHAWSAWVWLSSLVFPDDTVKKSIVDHAWNCLLPQLIAAGFDLESPCQLATLSSMSRRQWLEKQDAGRFQEAMIEGERLALHRTFDTTTCNNASRRL